MKKKDFLWAGTVILLLCLLLLNPTARYYQWFNGAHPYLAGFAKFAVLSTMGDALAVRIVHKGWVKVPGLGWRALVYGGIGALMTLVFQLFSGGVAFAMQGGFLPFEGSALSAAFFTSVCMNCLFAPTFMAFHRVSDTYIDLRCAGKKPTLREVASAVDFAGFVTFVVAKTIPLFWIPAHTITFLLPGEYRVLFAACLSVAMGAILSFAKAKRS